MKYEKSIGLALTVSMVCATPFAVQASDGKYKLVLTSEAGDRDSVLGKSMQAWAESIETESDGRMKLDVFYQGELGGQQELFDQLVTGNVHKMITWPQTSNDQRIGVNYLPYLVMGWEDAIESFGQDGWIRQCIEPVYQDMGLKYFGPFPEGFGGVATKGRYATSIEGAKGLKVRSQPIFPLPQTIEAMGFQAVPIDWAEVYTSIQTSVAESSAQSVIDQQFAGAKIDDEKWISAAQEAGMEYIVPTAEEKAAWVEKNRTEVWLQAEEALGSEIMDVVRTNASVPE